MNEMMLNRVSLRLVGRLCSTLSVMGRKILFLLLFQGRLREMVAQMAIQLETMFYMHIQLLSIYIRRLTFLHYLLNRLFARMEIISVMNSRYYRKKKEKLQNFFFTRSRLFTENLASRDESVSCRPEVCPVQCTQYL